MRDKPIKTKALLQVDKLSIGFPSLATGEVVWQTDDVSFTIGKGEKLGIVGESGSGKSITARALMRLVTADGIEQYRGNVCYDSREVLIMDVPLLSTMRGAQIGLITQEPMSALNPTIKCGEQIKEVLDIHSIGEKKQRIERVKSLLSQVQLSDEERIYNAYPHELSGGQQQRVCIAMAIAAQPHLLICDEPTTALDKSTQEEVIKLLDELVQDNNMAMLFISHDIDVVAQLCDRIIVMYDGKIVERGSTDDIIEKPSHSYTKALMMCQPTAEKKDWLLPTVPEVVAGKYVPIERPATKTSSDVIISISGLNKSYPSRQSKEGNTVLDDVNLKIRRGEILGILGDSGSGKSTLANCMAGLIDYDSGVIMKDDMPIDRITLSSTKELRQSIQMIFQDPYSSLNPKQTIGSAITEAVLAGSHDMSLAIAREKAHNLLRKVGLDIGYTDRYPHALSGGERQRVSIARAIAVKPEILICDECVSALDVSVQAQVLNLLVQLRAEYALTIVFISHDRAVVNYLCDRVMEMRSGKLSPISIPY